MTDTGRSERADFIETVLKPAIADLATGPTVAEILSDGLMTLSALSAMLSEDRREDERAALNERLVHELVDLLRKVTFASAVAESHQMIERASELSAMQRLMDGRRLHELGVRYRAGNRLAELLDGALFDQLERAGCVDLCPWARGMIEASLHMYRDALANKKMHKHVERKQRQWEQITKQAESLLASLASSGALEDPRWCRANIIGPPNLLVEQLSFISRSGPPAVLTKNLQTADAVLSQTPLTDRSVGFGYGVLTYFLRGATDLVSRWEVEKKRRPDGAQAAIAGKLKPRRRGAAETDVLLSQLAECYHRAGGDVAISWADEAKTIVGGPFARFLETLWHVLPPAGRPKTAQTFARRAKERLPQLRGSIV